MMLENRVALVTGSCGEGIGRSIAFSLAREGANIVLNYGTYTKERAPALKVAAAIKGLGARVLIVRADTTRPQQVKRMIEAATRRFGRLDILVNNAGGGWQQTPIAEVEPQFWKSVIEAELNAVFYAVRYALPIMRKQRWGRIINIGWWDAEPWREPPFDYSIGKAARHLLARKLAPSEAKNGITINNICPGDTPHISFDEAVRAAKDPADRTRPIKPSPPDIAEIAVWLCSDAARFVSGSNIWVMGREAM